MRDRRWLPYAALAAVLGLLAASTWSLSILSDAFAIAAGICGLGAVILFVRGSRQSRYDLDSLRQVHERAELDAIEVPEPEDYDSVHCLCGSVYDRTLPVCPKCRRSQHSAC